MTTSIKDLEAQVEARPPPAQDLRKSSVVYAGRGGAGNITDTQKLTKPTSKNTNPTAGGQERRPSMNPYQGRGGAGNYNDGSAEKVAQHAKQANMHAKIHQEAVEMVDMTLKEPEQVHLKGQDDPL